MANWETSNSSVGGGVVLGFRKNPGNGVEFGFTFVFEDQGLGGRRRVPERN